MKSSIRYSILLAAAALPGTVLGQTASASTSPVGYVTLGDTTPGQPSVKANTDSYISIPLFRSSEGSGTVSTVNATTKVITLSGTPGFTVNQFVSTTTPYMVLVENGASSGLVGMVTANTANTLTLMLQPGEVMTGIAANDRISIRKAWTLAAISAGNSLPSGTLVSVFGGNQGINVTPDTIYEFDGTTWFNTDDFSDASSSIIYPGEGLKLRSPATVAIPKITLSGDVALSNSRLILSKPLSTKGQDNFISYVSPVAESIASSNLGVSSGDLLIDWNNGTAGINRVPSKIYEFDGTSWFDTDDFSDVTSTLTLQPGKAYRYRRAQTAPVGFVIGSDQPSFIPSL